MILNVGDVSYASYSKQVLDDYFHRHAIEHHYITNAPLELDMKNAHPSWWKLLAHKILPGYDFIICWDLDLLPRTPFVKVLQDFDTSALNLAWDYTALMAPKTKFLPSFKYNGGLIGIPSSASSFLEGVFEKHAPGTYPSYEQYYLNEELESQNYPVHELPKDLNIFYSIPEYTRARLQHYTWHHDAKSKIKDHVGKYFSSNDYITGLCGKYSLISTERMLTNIDSIEYIQKNKIEGDIVEVGVWKGGSLLSMILKYDWYNETNRTFHAYDIFEELVSLEGGSDDVSIYGNKEMIPKSLICKLSETQQNIYSNTEYPRKKIKFYTGDVQKGCYVPDKIAILRLDVDFYELTKFCLHNFYEKVVPGGMVIIDDYGHWKGCKKAIDEYFPGLEFQRSDYTGIFFIKV
jgi:hypothetical protein